MLMSRCAGTRPDGRGCRSYPLRGERFCLWHSPDHEEEAKEARRLGGMRRRREKTVAGAYDLNGLATIEDLRRLVEIAALDTLGLENSIPRSRTLVSVALAGAKLIEVGEIEARLATVEAALEDERTRRAARAGRRGAAMALARRLSRAERDLDVKGCILHWLAEAHGFGSMEAYARWTVEQPEPRDPFARLLDRVEAAARKAQRKEPPAVVRRAVKAAHREAMFASYLVVRLNSEAEERLVSLGLAQMALMYWMRELALREALAEHGDEAAWLADAEGLDGTWNHWREAMTSLLIGLHEAGAARHTLEDRYLSGHLSLFPSTADAWRDLVERSEGLYEVATTLHPDDSFEPLEALRERSTSGAAATAERLGRMASVETHSAMGERIEAEAAVRALMDHEA